MSHLNNKIKLSRCFKVLIEPGNIGERKKNSNSEALVDFIIYTGKHKMIQIRKNDFREKLVYINQIVFNWNLPIGNARFIEGHEINLRCSAAFRRTEENFIISFTKKFEFLSFFVHEYAIQMPGINGSNFDCFISPTHYLIGRNISWKLKVV